MRGKIAPFVSLLFVALLAGSVFVIFLIVNPHGMSPVFYVETMQRAIGALTTPLSVVGGLAVLSTIVSAFSARGDRPRVYLLIAASVCVTGLALVTIFGNFPINDQIITWSGSSPPANWTKLRDKWWSFHVARSILAIAGLCFLILGTLAHREWGDCS